MFNGKNIKIEAEEIASSQNIIGKGTVIKGHIEAAANIRIEGKVEGDIKTKSKVAIGETSVVEGNIYAQNAEVAGTVKGHVEVTDLLTLKASCVIKGDIQTNKLVIESGAKFNGSCKMITEIKSSTLPDTDLANKNGKPKEAVS